MNYKQYDVVVADSIEELNKLVQAKLKQGWEPWGSLNHYLSGGTLKRATFYQAVVMTDSTITKATTVVRAPATTKKVLD